MVQTIKKCFPFMEKTILFVHFYVENVAVFNRLKPKVQHFRKV